MTDTSIKVNSQTQLYGIFGHPVRHSLSPLIHNSLFQKLKINATYLAFDINLENLGLAFEAIRSLDIRGVNITIPFKETAIEFIDEIPEDIDRCIGALNTIVNRDGKLYGYNTDGPGFLTALNEELGFNPEGKKILVLGAGGAARGVVFSLARAHAERILIYNRTIQRAEGLAEYVEEHFPELDVEPFDTEESLYAENFDLVVNATSLGMHPKDPAPIDLKRLPKNIKIYDLVYSPAETFLAKTAKSLGVASTNGLGMLAAQAALSFELWTGKKEGVRETMLEILKTCPF